MSESSKKSIAQQILEANKRHNKVLTLEELIKARQDGEIQFEIKAPVDNYVYVHVTDFMPEQNQILTVYQKEKNEKIDYGYEYFYHGRDTVHLTVNGRVLSHDDGNWDQRKYAIIILARDFIDNNKENIVSIATQDTFVDGNTNISGAFIICPKSDYEEILKKNPDTIVIPIDAERAVDVKEKKDDFVKVFIRELLGLVDKKCTKDGWQETPFDTYELEEINKYIKIISEYCGKEMAYIQHEDSITKVLYRLRNGKGTENRGCIKSFYLDPKEQGMSVERMKQYAEEIDRCLASDGVGIWYGIYYFGDNEVRRSENRIIEEYLNVGIKDIYDGDIVSTNLKRIKMIVEKMKTDEDKNQATEALMYALLHFLDDYVLMRDNYSKRQDMKDMDFELYTKQIKHEFAELGIKIDEIDDLRGNRFYSQSKAITNRIIKEQEIEQLLKEQGFIEEPCDSFALRDAKRLVMLENIMQSELINSAKKGKLDDSGLYEFSTTWKRASNLEDHIAELLIQRFSKEGISPETEEQLELLGLTADDFKDGELLIAKLADNLQKHYDNAEAIARGEEVDLPFYLKESYKETALRSSEVEDAMRLLRSETQLTTDKGEEEIHEEQ